MGLATYRKKRDFRLTGEPKGTTKPLPKAVRGASRFVIQKHDASRLHYDFRLEMDGVLKSWAVPKGLPWKQGEKHLAVEVEDHPVEYADFEGIIPAGQYGGGTVMVWDKGEYYVYGEKPLEAWREGKMHLVLNGKKARGEWTLIRIRSNEAKNQWLLLKSGESLKPVSKKSDDQSAKTGRTMKQIAAASDAEWQSNRPDKGDAFKTRVAQAVAKRKTAPKAKRAWRGSAKSFPGLDELPKAKLRFIEPMKPRLVERPPSVGDWLYELKFDGIRAIAVKSGPGIKLISRNQKQLNGRFPEIAQGCEEIGGEEYVIDGEIVALDEAGRSSFQLLQRAELEDKTAPLAFYAFDLMQLNSHSTMSLPVVQRKAWLSQLLPASSDLIRFSGELGGDPDTLLAEIKRRGLEGLIGKLRESPYEPGRRSGSWVKIKSLNEQEFVIGGYTPPAGSRKHFGALLVGYYDKDRLVFAGKVGTGFDSRSLADLHKKLRAEKRDDCPFADLPSKQGGQWVQGITPAEMRRCTWVNPKFVCQIKFAEWTRDLKLRQPVFLGLREDKDPREVVREL
jgi:DNA ligase D, 3''-phosphoesterase domain/DNA polymerase LigD, ligase domain